MDTTMRIFGKIYPKRYPDIQEEISGYQPSNIRIRYPNYTIQIRIRKSGYAMDIQKKLSDRIIGLFGRSDDRIITIPFTRPNATLFFFGGWQLVAENKWNHRKYRFVVFKLQVNFSFFFKKKYSLSMYSFSRSY